MLIRNLNQINQQLPKIALTIGNFDGIHLAHHQIINYTKNIAEQNNLKSAILSFEPHPISFLNQKNNKNFDPNFRITNLSNKLKILKNYNFDYVIIIPFNKHFSLLNANFFIEKILIDKLNVKSLIVGYDFTFGKNREGNFKTLEQYPFDLHEINPIKTVDNSELTISSSLARKYIREGNVAILPKILGRNFNVDGLVISGNKLARQLGFHTANFRPRKDVIKPKYGVYKTRTFIYKFNRYFDSITNFGIKPTLENHQSEPIYENHIINFSQDIYDHKINVEFIDFLREEKKFSSLSELQNQIKSDLQNLI